MRNFGQCECGSSEWFGSDGPRPCQRCEKCGTGPGGSTPEPHEIEKRFNSRTGEPDGGLCYKCFTRFRDWEHPTDPGDN